MIEQITTHMAYYQSSKYHLLYLFLINEKKIWLTEIQVALV
jgi:hypothetical protein